MGKAWNENMPQAKSTSDAPESSGGCAGQNQLTRGSFLLLRHFGGELQSVGDEFVAGLYAIANFLHAVRSEAIGLHYDFAKALVALFAEDPVFVVQAHDGGGWHDNAVRQLAGTEGGHGVHAGTERAIGVAKHDANLGASGVGIKHARDISDLDLKSTRLNSSHR